MSDNELIERIEAHIEHVPNDIPLEFRASEIRALIALAKDGLILQKTLKDLTRLVNWSTVTPMPDKRPVIEAYRELIAAIQRERSSAAPPTIDGQPTRTETLYHEDVTPPDAQNGVWTVTGSDNEVRDGE